MALTALQKARQKNVVNVGRQQSAAAAKTTSAAAEKAALSTNPSRTSRPSGFAPGSRPSVITQNKGQVYKDAKLVVDYGIGAEAEAKAKARATEFTTIPQNIMGDLKGETYRTLNTKDRGSQTGLSNNAGIASSMAARGFKGLMSPIGAGGKDVLTGALSKSDYGKYMSPTPAITPQDSMDRIRKENQMRGGQAAEASALGDILKSGAEGGANSSLPMGTDIPGKLSTDPAFKKLLEESIATRVYGNPKNKPAAQTESFDTAPSDTTLADGDTTSTDVATMDEGNGTFTMQGATGTLADLMKKFGLSADAVSAQATPVSDGADTSAIDQQISDLADASYDPAAADQQYEAETAAIKQRYDAERAAATQAAENQYKQKVASLSQVGFNPLSSGGDALDAEKQALISKFMSDIDSRESVDKMNAAQTRSAAKSAAVTERMKYLKDKRDNTVSAEQTTYDRQRQSTQDALANINSVLSAAEKRQTLSNNERDNAVSSMKTMFDSFGATAFDALNPNDLRKFEKALSLPAGSLRTAISSFKEASKKTEKPELREVGGSLYQMTFDAATGEYVPKILIKKAAGSGSAGGNGTVRLSNGGEVSSSVVDTAMRDYYSAYADSGKGLESVSAADKSNIVTQWMMGGAGFSGNPFLNARQGAEDQFGGSSSTDDLSALLDAAAGVDTNGDGIPD